MKKRSANAGPAVNRKGSVAGQLLKMAVLVSGLALGPCVHAQTIDAYLQQAAQNNPGLKAAYSEYEASVQRIAQEKGWNDPMLTMSAFGEMVETRLGGQAASFSIEQQFPWFGTLKAKGDAAALRAEASLEMFQDARNELFYRVKAAYYPIAQTTQLIALNKDNLEILDTYKTLATARFSNGTGPMVDVIRIEILIDQLTAETKILERRHRALQSAFNAILNRDADQPVVVPDTLTLPQMPAGQWRDSLVNNPRIVADEKLSAAAAAAGRVARKEGMPMLGVGFNYIVIDPMPEMDHPDNGRDAYMPMLSVSLPIYRKKYKAAIKEAEHMQAYYRHSGKEQLTRLTGELAMVQSDIENAREQHESLHHHATLSRQAIRLLLAAVETGEQSYEEVLRMQQELLMHESERIMVVTEAWLAAARLEYLVAGSMH